MSREWAVALAAAVVAAIVVCAVIASGHEAREAPHAGPTELLGGTIPVRSGITLPPGSPLGHGFVVEEGSALVGGTLPFLYSTAGGERVEDDGWEANLLVTVPGRQVFEDYVKQAVDLGFPLVDPSCTVANAALRCEAASTEGDPGYENGYDHFRELGIGLDQRPGGGGRPPTSYIRIVVREVGEPPWGAPMEGDAIVGGSAGPGEVPNAWPDIAGIGESWWSADRFEVVPGTTLLIHPRETDGSGAAAGLFEVTGDPESVLAALVHQTGGSLENEEVVTWTRAGATVHTLYWGWGRATYVRIVERDGQPTLMVVENHTSD